MPAVLWDLMLLAGSQGKSVTVVTEGDDAKAALK